MATGKTSARVMVTMGKRINRDKSGEMARPLFFESLSYEMSCILLSRSSYFRLPCTLRGIKADYD
jgi:hypothetical protein